uniref:Uncharacterized protein n=1 Tax=Nelumbo nucifera TaxID=4432 RepID=A0A822Y321_NELNU|nr:TPA_asm: hypothetical protein HUJ06_029782 [Nelumbo nucifera]
MKIATQTTPIPKALRLTIFLSTVEIWKFSPLSLM